MSTQIAIGFSQSSRVNEAISQACIAIRNQLANKNPDFIFVLATPSHIHPDLLTSIQNILKPTRLIGASTAAIILTEGTFTRGIAILGVISKDMSFGITSTLPNASSDLRQAGVDWAHRLMEDVKSTHHEATLLLADHTHRLHPSFILGIQEVLGNGSPLAGALASDDFKFYKTSLFYQKHILNQGLLGMVISASKVSIGNTHGFKPLGKPRTITLAENNVIKMIDGQPAINIYKEFLGKEAEALTHSTFGMHALLYPLGIYIETQRKYLVKNAIDITLEGSIVVTGDVPQGAEIHLMIGNKESCRRSATDAATQVKTALGGRQAKLILVIESAGRQKILKNNSTVEVVAMRELLGYTTPIFGMCSFGEIIPLASGFGATNTNNVHIQNGSITIIAID